MRHSRARPAPSHPRRKSCRLDPATPLPETQTYPPPPAMPLMNKKDHETRTDPMFFMS
jgi:hypothetical protein